MRLCVVYDCLFPYTVGGGERWYRNVAERMAREGHEVTYLTLRQWQRGERVDIEGVRVVAVGPRMALYTAGGRRRILPPLLFGLGVLAHLLRHGRDYDVVDTCAFPYFSLLAAALVRPLHGFELVVDWFEVWSSSYWREYLGPAGGAVGMLVQRLCALVPQRAYCFSELHAGRLRQEGLRGPLTVLRGLYAPAVAPMPGAAGAQPTVLVAGRLIPEKRVPLAVAAIALATRRIEGLRAVIVGDGPEREAVSAAIAEHGLTDAVTAAGFAPGELVEREMGQAMCMLLTSRREGYGMVVVEAAAHGSPSVVLAGEDNAATELIEEGVNGTIVSGEDAAAIAEGIVRVHAAGEALRASTREWYAQNSSKLSLASSLARVLEDYERARA